MPKNVQGFCKKSRDFNIFCGLRSIISNILTDVFLHLFKLIEEAKKSQIITDHRVTNECQEVYLLSSCQIFFNICSSLKKVQNNAKTKSFLNLSLSFIFLGMQNLYFVFQSDCLLCISYPGSSTNVVSWSLFSMAQKANRLPCTEQFELQLAAHTDLITDCCQEPWVNTSTKSTSLIIQN